VPELRRALAWPSRLPPRLLHHRPTHDPAGSWSVYRPRGLRPLVIPLPPRFARAVLHPRYARARPAPSASWLAMSTAPRRAASASLAPSQAPSRALLWTRTTFRCVAGEPTLSPSSPLRGSPKPVLCAASAAVTQAAKRCRECKRGCPCRQLVRQRLRLITRATVIRNVNACSPLPKAMNRASRAVTVHAHDLARATRIGHANGDPTRYKDPALLTELAEKPSSAPAPLAVWLRHFNASLLLSPCPASPDPMRHTHRVNT
jgi:hypothetical protein